MVAAARQAIAIWGDALDRHFDRVVTLTDMTDDHEKAARADTRVHFIPHWSGTKWSGMAVCGDDKCNNVYVKSEFPPGSFGHKFGDPPQFTAELVGQIALHELGHALGLGHAQPISTTDDIMGYGFIPWLVSGPVRTPVISVCDMKGLEEIFAWRSEGTEPRRPTSAEIVCST